MSASSLPATELGVYFFCGIPVLAGFYLYLRSTWSTRDGHKVLLGYPIIGCALEMTPTSIFDTILKYALKHGPVFDMYILNRRMTFVSNVNDMKEILRLRPKTFQRGQKIIAPIRAIRMGDGLFAAEGSTWSVHRRIVSPAFSRQNISRWMDALWNEAENLVVMIKPSAEKGTPVDFAVVSTEFTIRVIGKVAFGFTDQEDGGRYFYSLQFIDDLKKMTEFVTQRTLFPLPDFVWKLIPSKVKYETDAMNARERVESCGRKVIAAAQKRSKNADDSESFVNYLLKAEEGFKLTDAEVISNILTMFVAGSDTTAVAIAWAFYFLSLHPEAMEAARAEAMGLDDSKHNPPLTATEKMAGLRYCNACLTEAMRLRSPVMWLLFQSVSGEDYTLSSGLKISGKGTTALALDAAKRDPVVFEEPERYNPQRWLTEDEEKLRAMREYCISFGGGPRTCPGADLAVAEGTFAIASMVTRYTWKLACGPHEVKRIVKLSVQVDKMPFVFTPL